MKRRDLLKGIGTGLIFAPFVAKGAFALQPRTPLPIPQIIDVDGGSGNLIEAIEGKHSFFDGASTRTAGFSQDYLGPILRMKRGSTARINVANKTRDWVTSHWHGMHVPGNLDGGPQLAFKPGDTWSPELEIDQPEATLWYHSHVHMKTAAQVYAGLAGMIYIEDPALAGSTGLPNTHGVDDIPLIIQDKAFNEDGSLYHDNFGPNMMFGFRGDVALVNGAVSPKADIPAGLVRLRLLNASNARIFTLRFEDDREFHQIASDGGYLPAPRKMNSLVLAPAERVEIVVDFSSPGDVRLLSLPDANALDGGMMSGFMHRMMGRGRLVPDGMNENDEFEIMTFSPDTSRKTEHSVLPAVIAGAPDIDFGEPVRRRTFSLEMHAGGGMMGGMMGRGQGGMMGGMGINGIPMDMGAINETVKIGETELWEVTTSEMAHPFHIHGTSFKVASNNGAPVEYAATGLKDVFLVSDRAEFLVRFDKPADAGTPFMYHCHILEHEDAGMMGQFTVS